jgi:SAM-dependent methyltransferase
MLDAIQTRNRRFYDSVWRRAKVRNPRWFATWKLVEEVTAGAVRTLEVGPGVRPRFPSDTATYVDISREAVHKLRRAGARVLLADVQSLPFADGAFDAAAAIDVAEHAEDPATAIRELARVLREGGRMLLAVPVRSANWTEFDDIVGHKTRFEPDELASLLEENGLQVTRSAAFGILPRSRLLVRIGAWGLTRLRGPAAWFEDRVVMSVAHILERPLRWRDGFHCGPGADGIIVECQKRTIEIAPPIAR